MRKKILERSSSLLKEGAELRFRILALNYHTKITLSIYPPTYLCNHLSIRALSHRKATSERGERKEMEFGIRGPVSSV